MKGNQILSPFDMSNYDYTFKSTGHNSIYKTVNNAGEIVSVHSVHARPNTNTNHNWDAIPDNALATCQSEVDGNINLINQVAYNSLGWPVLMPYQYDGTDTVTANIKAKDLQGVYAADDLRTYVSDTWAPQYNYTIIADDEDENAAYEYGTDEGGDTFTDYIVLSTAPDGTRWANYYAKKSDYDPNNPNNNLAYCGVVGKHGDEICISMICPEDREHTWTYRIGEIPDAADVESLGNSVSMDGVIYTHLAKDMYTKYGYEISDNFNYGKAGSTGERYTTITLTYPAKIDTSNPTAIYCMSDEERCNSGEYSGGDFRVIPLNNNRWYDDSGNYFTDDQAIDLEGVSDRDGSTLHRLYGLQGYVSNYHFDSQTGIYADEGVTLIVTYNNVETGAQYSEFEFCYVTANPSMAHSIVGLRNKRSGGTFTEEMRFGLALFSRMEGSEGSATSLEPVAKKINATVDGKNETTEHFGTGNFNYLYQFPDTADSISDSHYSGADNINNSFVNYNSKVGTNSGSFGLVEHYNDESDGKDTEDNRAMFTASANVVNADYYIDYSDDENNLITYSNGKPTGYSFNFFVSNLYWTPHANAKNYDGTGTDADSIHRATSFVKNGTGINMTSSVAPIMKHAYNATRENNKYYYIAPNGYNSDDGNYFKINNTGIQNGNEWLLNHQGIVSGTNYQTVLKTMTSDGTADYSKLTKAFTYVDSGYNETAGWQGRLNFTGTKFQNVEKETGNTAESAHNFAFEQGLTLKLEWLNGWGASSEQTFHYYNIGVATCDKGAARTFANNYIKRKLATTEDPETHKITVKVDSTTGAPIYLDEDGEETTDVDEAAIINAQEYSVDSYNDYIDSFAELEWFVENPKNTMFKDYADSGSNASTKYITAYTNSGDPIYITSTSGKNIFGDSSNNTDMVQAKLIDNVIKAYENLFSIEDYSEAEEAYNKIEITNNDTVINLYTDEEKETIDKTYSKDNYTDDSWDNFVNLVKNIDEAFDYDKSDTHGSHESSWRNVTIPGDEYRKLRSILEDTEYSLMPKVDTQDLETLITSKTADVNAGIFVGENNSQLYTPSSLNRLNDRITVAEALETPAQTDADATYTDKSGVSHTFDVGKYDVTTVHEYEFDDVVFYAQEYDHTAFNISNYKNTGHPSAGQIAIYDELNVGNGVVGAGDNHSVLGGMGPEEVGDYSAYDAALENLKFQDIGAFSSAYLSSADSIFAKLRAKGVNATTLSFGVGVETPQVVTTPAYDYAGSTKEIPYVIYQGQVVKDLSDSAGDMAKLDAVIADIVSALNTVNAGTENVTAKYTVTFKINTDGQDGTPSTVDYYYGSKQTFNAQGAYKWTIECNGTTMTTPGANSYTYSVQGDATITAYVSSTATEGNIRVKLYDAYKNPVQEYTVANDATIELGSGGTLSIAGTTTHSVDYYPCYVFKNWQINGSESATPFGTYTASSLASEGVIEIQPTYTIERSEISVEYNGTPISEAKTDEMITLPIGDAVAIAGLSGTTLNAVSYGSSFSCYAQDGMKFVGIMQDANGYYYNAGSGRVNVPTAIASAIAKTTPSAYSVSSKDAETGVFTTHTVPTAGVTVTECGTIYALGTTATWNDSNFVIGGSGVYKNAAKNPDELTGQYWLGIRVGNRDVVTRAYVKYKYTVGFATIETIVYGNICST